MTDINEESGNSVAVFLPFSSNTLILRESLKRAGIGEKGFSGHSLRAGFVTVATINGASERDIQKITGHVSLEVLRRYIRDADIFRESASRKLGL